MPVTRLEILDRYPYADGRPFGAVGAYERIEAVAHYAVDPEAPENRAIVDLDLAARGDDGLVHFSGDLTILMPADAARANRSLLLMVPNRGRRLVTYINTGEIPVTPTATIEPGDGWLFEEGWTIAWTGWQWDVPRDVERLRIGLEVPMVPPERIGPASPPMQLRLQVSRRAEALPLTDQHVGDLGRHRTIAPRDLADPAARLLRRRGPYGEAETVPRGDWRFADEEHVALDGGFEPGVIYDLLYHPKECPVVGAGLIATRDMARFLRSAAEAPTAGRIEHVIGEGFSQTGRFWRTFLLHGLNRASDGGAAVDGILCHIAGARRGEFNFRYAQPSVQPTPSLGHLFPFADEVQSDPKTGARDGLLERQRSLGQVPKIVYTDTGAEYWRGDAALAHTSLAGHTDFELPAGTRRYYFSGTQHTPGLPVLTDTSLFGSKGGNLLNIVDYRPLYRAALANLRAWVVEGREPPPSRYPRLANGTRLVRAEALDKLAKIPGMALPKEALITAIRPLDLGPEAEAGRPTLPAKPTAEPHPAFVSALDDDGNETGGVALPVVARAVATLTGFNPRHPSTGGEGEILDYFGSTVPFPKTVADREATGDPRRAIEERYRDRDDYVAKVRRAAEELAQAGYLLKRDIGLCCDMAATHYDLMMSR